MFRRHFVVFALMALSALWFIVQSASPSSLSAAHGAVPYRLLAAWRGLLAGHVDAETWAAGATLFSSLFLHGDAEHLVGNMLYLWVLGCVVRNITGGAWVFALYMICGAAGQVIQSVLQPLSPVPTIGASGAIAGLAGMYFGLALSWQLPHAEVWPLSGPVSSARLAVFAVAGFILDVWSLHNGESGIAYGAHVGGFMTGLLIAACVTARHATLERFQFRRRG